MPFVRVLVCPVPFLEPSSKMELWAEPEIREVQFGPEHIPHPVIDPTTNASRAY